MNNPQEASNLVRKTNISNEVDSRKSRSNFYIDDIGLDGNDLHIPRESIAMGSATLAARESVIRLQMEMQEDSYIELQSFRIFIGSWNINGQSASVSLGEYWLSVDPNPPDIYAIGFQELDLSKEAFLFNDTPREEEWLQACILSLHPNEDYVKLKLIRLIGMMMIVFVKKDLESNICNLSAETVGTGILGKMGNKGAVAISFDLHNTSLCFVNCHLAAGVEEYERRNQDYNEICNRMLFKSYKSIKDHDHIYWFGDLNYRIMDLSAEQVKKCIDSQSFDYLFQHDQLKMQQFSKKVFIGYDEGPIRHMPTYKYDTGTDNWDSSEKNRPPAWCDRVLWRGGPTKMLSYRSHPKLKISDHKPVSCLFDASIKVVDYSRYRNIYEDVMKKLDRLENEFLPQVAVDRMEISFDRLTFRESVYRTLTIANTGQVPVKFEFIKKPNYVSYCKEWLRIEPHTHMIKPGDKVDVGLEVFVDINSAAKLNSGKDNLDDILVLHLEGGKDLFITVIGTYEPSCFGSSIKTLIRLKCPITDLTHEELLRLEKDDECMKEKFPVCWDIPKEIWVLVDQLFKYGLAEEDLFQQSGLKSEFQMIRFALDSSFPEKLPASVHSIAEALLMFLGALADPVIPFQYYSRALDSSNNFVLCKQIINEIDDNHRRVFYYLIAFMRELLRHSNYNRLEQKLLATVFGSILLRCPLKDDKEKGISLSAQQSEERKKAAFVHHFLINDFDV